MTEHGNGALTTQQTLHVFAQMMQRLVLRDGVTFEGHRDLYATLGYPRTVTFADYYEKYTRGGIAKTLIDAFAEDTWRAVPQLRDLGKPDETSPSVLEHAWERLATRLRLWRVIRRVDRQARLGRFAVLVLGLRGQTDLQTPAMPVRRPEDLLYVQAFSEEHCELRALVSDDASPLFGRPQWYALDFSRQQADVGGGGRPVLAGQYGQRVVVHASRVIHVTEGGFEDDLIGPPALEAAWNDLLDLQKETGGTAEMVWKDAKRRIVAALREGAVLSAEDEARFDDRVKQFMHQLLDVLQVQNIDIHQLEGKVPDASASIDKRVELLCGLFRMPKRRLLGTERGELASTQDAGDWLVNVIGGRQKTFGEEMILNPLWISALPSGFCRPPTTATSGTGRHSSPKASRKRRTRPWPGVGAIQAYAGPGGSPQEILPVEIYLQDIVGWAPEQVERIMDMLGEQEAVRQRALPGPADAEEDEDEDENALTEDSE